jgi:hypothetical protein
MKPPFLHYETAPARKFTQIQNFKKDQIPRNKSHETSFLHYETEEEL